MASAAPLEEAFTLASELGPSVSREEELESLCHQQAEQLELLQDGTPGQMPADMERRLKSLESRVAWTHDEKQALVEKISDLSESVKLLEKAVKKILDNRNVNDRIEERITDVKDLAKTRIDELDKKIVDKNIVNEIRTDLDEVRDLIDQHAEAINTVWKAIRKAPVPTGKKSLARIEKLKEILKAGPKSYKELERILDVSPKEMNRLVSMLDTRSYEIFFRAGDGRQKVLRLRAWNATQQASKSFPSNVKYSAGGDSMGP